MNSVCISSCVAVSTSPSTYLVSSTECSPTAGGQKFMYPTSGLSGRPYQFCSSREQVTAWAPVVGRHAEVGYADTKTAKSASGMPSPPGSVVQPLPLHTLQGANGDESSTYVLHVRQGTCCTRYAAQRNTGRSGCWTHSVSPKNSSGGS